MNSRKMIALFMITLLTFGALDALAAYSDSGTGSGDGEGTDTELKVFGSSRYRMNTDRFDFDSDTPLNWFSEMQTRVGIKAMANEKVGAFFQLQDSRIIGLNPGYNYTNQNIQMHQGYMWYKPCEMGWLKAGRFEVTMHNGRLISSVPWDNTGRTFEGLQFGRKLNENIGITAMALQIEERYDSYNDADGDPIADQMFYGLNVNFAEQMVDLFMYMWNNPSTTADDDQLMTFGAYSNREFGTDMWYDSMFAMQTGTMSNGNDMSGMLAYAKIGKNFDKFDLAVGVDYTTGDDPTTTDKNEGFNNLFYDYHRYYGTMDMINFMGAPSEGVMDLFLNAKYMVNESWKAGASYHMFSTVEDMPGAGTASGNDETALGSELDLFVKYSAEDFSWETGYGMFSLNEDTFGSNQDSQGWWYSQAMVNW